MIVVHGKNGRLEAQLDYKESNKTWDYKTSLKEWLSEDLEFSKLEGATFSEQMVLATVAWDKDHTIYVLVPESIFSKEENK